MYELSWRWIALMLTVPPVAGTLAALPLWRQKQMVLGNIVGTLVIFAAGIGMILRESAELQRLMQRCFDAGFLICWPEPSAFTRYAIYATIALLEVFALFSFSLTIERRVRRRGYAPEWR